LFFIEFIIDYLSSSDITVFLGTMPGSEVDVLNRIYNSNNKDAMYAIVTITLATTDGKVVCLYI
jgi:hypothetical protein